MNSKNVKQKNWSGHRVRRVKKVIVWQCIGRQPFMDGLKVRIWLTAQKHLNIMLKFFLLMPVMLITKPVKGIQHHLETATNHSHNTFTLLTVKAEIRFKDNQERYARRCPLSKTEKLKSGLKKNK